MPVLGAQMFSEPDYYKILQVSPDADLAVIESAFKTLIKKYHPDANPCEPENKEAKKAKEDKAETAKLINQAHDVLKDTEKRKAYDLRRKLGGVDRAAHPTPIPNADPQEVDFGEVETGSTPPQKEIWITNQGGMPESIQPQFKSPALSVIGLPISPPFQFPMRLRIQLTCTADLKDGVHNNSVTIFFDSVPLEIRVTYQVLDGDTIETNRRRYRTVLTSDAVRNVGRHWPKGSDHWNSMLLRALSNLDQYDVEEANRVLEWFNNDCRQRRAHSGQA